MGGKHRYHHLPWVTDAARLLPLKRLRREQLCGPADFITRFQVYVDDARRLHRRWVCLCRPVSLVQPRFRGLASHLVCPRMFYRDQ